MDVPGGAVQLLAQGAEPARVLREVLLAAARASGATGAVVSMRRGTECVEVAAHGTVEDVLRSTAREAIESSRPVHRSDPVRHLNASAVPVVASGQVVGALGVCGPADRLDASELSVATDLTALCFARASGQSGGPEAVEALASIGDAHAREDLAGATLEALSRLGLPAGFVCLDEEGRLRVARYQGVDRDRVTALVSSAEFLAVVGTLRSQAPPAAGCEVASPEGDASVLVCAGLGESADLGILVAVVGHDETASACAVVAPVSRHVSAALDHLAAQERIRDQERQMEGVVRTSPGPALVLDAAGALRVVNSDASELLGLSNEFDVGRPVAERLGDPTLRSLLETGQSGEAEVGLGTPARTYRATVASLRDHDRSLGTALFLEDVSARQEHEQARDDFTAVIGHELRTPLTVAKGFLETVLARGEDMSEEDRTECLGTALAQTERLEVLVNDLLFLTTERPRAGVAADQCDVFVLAEATVRNILARHPDRDVGCLSLGGDTTAALDRRLVSHALRHLVDNAVKYSEGPVQVEVGGDASSVEVAVVDQGPGIFSGELERLFKPFEQHDSTSTRRHGGTGLGLFVTRAIVEAMGGRLDCDSRLGQGSRFTFRLPKRATMRPVETDHLRSSGRGGGTT
ncbi:MAG: hypothetical protein HYU28_01660 [Actinobacteria bacterium]|nr:hypothetical protein [Actinomycetota bacterium]